MTSPWGAAILNRQSRNFNPKEKDSWLLKPNLVRSIWTNSTPC
jgi:hypothetical protein